MIEDKYSSLFERERAKINLKLVEAFKDRSPASLYEPSAYIVGGDGKRIRPMLVLFSTKIAGSSFERSYNAAAAVELLHNFTLVHDDIMDNAPMRRGKVTLHKKYNDNTAILAGDSLLSIAYEYLLKDTNGNSKEVISSFTKGLIEVCEGQSYDTEFELLKKVSMDEYLMMIGKKTAAMIRMCCEIGVLIGNGSSEVLSGLSDYGMNLGMAFQIQDDLLDIAAEEKHLGKKIGGDLIEGKKTFLFIKALEKAEGKEYDELMKVIDQKGINDAEVTKYKKIYEKLNILDDAKEMINDYTEKALRSLNIIEHKEDKDLLIWMANFLLKRNK